MLNLRKTAALLLSLSLAFSVSACSGSGKKGGGGGEENKTVRTSSDGREMVGNTYTTGLPIVKEKITFKFMLPGTKDPNEMAFFKQMEEKTNIHVEWELFPVDSATEKKNLMFASGTYPDAMGGWFLNSNDIQNYGPKGVLVKLNELLPKYAPNFSKLLEKNQDIRKVITTTDKNIYTFPIITNPTPTTSDLSFINKTWLDKVGMKVPTTTDEFYNVLKAFKEKDPNGNGKNDELPFTFWHGNSNNGLYSFFGSFGRVHNAKYVAVENGKVLFTAAQPEYKEAIKYFAKLYKEGLIDIEALTQNKNQYFAKCKQELAIVGTFVNWNGVVAAGADKMKKGEYVPLPPLKGPSGKQQWKQGDSSVFKNQMAITSAAKNKEAIVRWVDNLYDTENSIQIGWGPLGTIVEKKPDGMYEMLPTPNGMSATEFRDANTVSSLPYAIMPDLGAKKKISEEEKLKNEYGKAFEPFLVKEYYPDVWFTLEDQKELSKIEADIFKFAGDYQAKWIAGGSNIDSDWDKYIEDLKKMKIDKWVEIYQKALDAYKSN